MKSKLQITEVDGDRSSSCFVIELITDGTVTLISDDPWYFDTGIERIKALKEARICAKPIAKSLGLKIHEELYS